MFLFATFIKDTCMKLDCSHTAMTLMIAPRAKAIAKSKTFISKIRRNSSIFSIFAYDSQVFDRSIVLHKTYVLIINEIQSMFP